MSAVGDLRIDLRDPSGQPRPQLPTGVVGGVIDRLPGEPTPDVGGEFAGAARDLPRLAQIDQSGVKGVEQNREVLDQASARSTRSCAVRVDQVSAVAASAGAGAMSRPVSSRRPVALLQVVQGLQQLCIRPGLDRLGGRGEVDRIAVA